MRTLCASSLHFSSRLSDHRRHCLLTLFAVDFVSFGSSKNEPAWPLHLYHFRTYASNSMPESGKNAAGVELLGVGDAARLNEAHRFIHAMKGLFATEQR